MSGSFFEFIGGNTDQRKPLSIEPLFRPCSYGNVEFAKVHFGAVSVLGRDMTFADAVALRDWLSRAIGDQAECRPTK